MTGFAKRDLFANNVISREWPIKFAFFLYYSMLAFNAISLQQRVVALHTASQKLIVSVKPLKRTVT